MSLLQKKCMMASVVTHGFLLFLLVAGSAFFVPEPEPPTKVTSMEVIPSELVDAALNPGGGIPQPEATQPQPQPEPKPEVKKPEPKPELKPEPKKPELKPEVKKPEPKPEVKKVEPKKVEPKKVEPLKLTRATPDDLKKRVTKPAPQPEGPDLSKVLKDSANNLAKKHAGTSSLKMVGPGDGNAGNYDSFVYQKYKNAWRVPAGLNDDTVSTEVEVVISRSGSVIQKRILRRSGNSLLDRSIEELIERVKFIAPFPAETKDQQRTYQIEFNLRLKAIG